MKALFSFATSAACSSRTSPQDVL